MRFVAATAAVLILLSALSASAEARPAGTCPTPGDGLAVSRVVEIDASAGPLFGEITKSLREDSFLKPKEVVLTFDDGPLPWVTKSILDTLDRFCAKATFFSVGRMALTYPGTVREVLARGHTLGGHTFSHPSLPRLPLEEAKEEIERGLAAVAMAAGQPIAPFFRFPGLGDSPALLNYLQGRGIASFSVDVVSNDSFIGEPARLARLTVDRVEARKGGILLFHDIKAATAKALPTILTELKARGYKIVHLRAKEPLKTVADFDGELIPLLARAEQAVHAGKSTLVPFYGKAGPERVADAAPVTEVAPPPRQRPVPAVNASKQRTQPSPVERSQLASVRASGSEAEAVQSNADGWSPRVKRPQKRPAVTTPQPKF